MQVRCGRKKSPTISWTDRKLCRYNGSSDNFYYKIYLYLYEYVIVIVQFGTSAKTIVLHCQLGISYHTFSKFQGKFNFTF